MTGCVLDDQLADPNEPATATVEQPAANCSDWMCGSNSPVIAGREFHELNVRGEPNSAGFRIQKVTLGGEGVDMRVIGGQIAARRSDGSLVAGYDVAGLRLAVINDDTGVEYEVRITSVGGGAFWARVPDQTIKRLYTYTIQWIGPETTFRNVCVNPGNGEPTLGLDTYRAVVFEGDRVDGLRKAVVGLDNDWFNIGCAGHALAKLHLTGHTEAARFSGFQTTRDERTTMLKMITGDYCGTGRAFTVAGMPLTWADDHDWMSFSPSTAPLESRWTASGASCINKSRLDANPLLRPESYGSSARDEIEAECRRQMPSCVRTLTSYHLRSGHP